MIGCARVLVLQTIPDATVPRLRYLACSVILVCRMTHFSYFKIWLKEVVLMVITAFLKRLQVFFGMIGYLKHPFNHMRTGHGCS